MPAMVDQVSPGPRVALCSAGELFGGVERQLLGLCTYLRERGSEPLLVLFHDRELAAQARGQGIEPVILQARHSFDPQGAWQLAALLADYRTQVVHAHGYRAMVNCALARHRVRFGVVKTEHGLGEASGGRLVAWAKSRLYRRLETWATRSVGARVCYVTEDLRSHFARAHRGLPRQTIYNGIEPLAKAGRLQPPEFAAGGLNLVIAGRVSEVKGISFALRALARPGLPDSVRLHVIGTGPLLGRLQREARGLQLDGRVGFLGFRRNIHDYLAHCGALLMPSLHEGLPYTLLEAMSLEVPILASRVGGLAEVLRDDRTALLFAPGDVEGIQKAVGRLLSDPALGPSLGRNAGRDQRRRFTLAEMGRSYFQVYTEIGRGVEDVL